MSTLTRRDRDTRPDQSPFGRMDRMVDEWFRSLPMRRWAPERDWTGEDLIRVDELRDGDTMVLRAEIPGIDPQKDASVTVEDGMLILQAERRTDEENEESGYRRREMRYGSFARSLSLPDGVDESAITATYKDGILEVRVPLPAKPPAKEATLIPVTSG